VVYGQVNGEDGLGGCWGDGGLDRYTRGIDVSVWYLVELAIAREQGRHTPNASWVRLMQSVTYAVATHPPATRHIPLEFPMAVDHAIDLNSSKVIPVDDSSKRPVLL